MVRQASRLHHLFYSRLENNDAMSVLRPDRSRTVFYRSNDPVRNFKLQIRLRRVTAALLSQAVQNDESATGVQSESLGALGIQEERIIGWQEKIFSQVLCRR